MPTRRQLITGAILATGTAIASAPLLAQGQTKKAASPSVLQVVKDLDGHSDVITSLAFSADGSRLYSASVDRSARIWNVATGKEQLRLQGHTGVVDPIVQAASNSSVVATGSGDRTARLWNVRNGAQIAVIDGFPSAVGGAALLPDGKAIITSSIEVVMWDATTRQRVRSFDGHKSSVRTMSISADGKRLLTGSDDKTVRLWDVNTGKLTLTLEGHTAAVTSVTFVDRAGSLVASTSQDQTLAIWDSRSGKRSMTVSFPSRVNSLAATVDGARLASGGHDNVVTITDVKSGRAIAATPKLAGRIYAVAFDPSGKLLAVGACSAMKESFGIQHCASGTISLFALPVP